ncbi:tail fiber assembly protein [Methanolacinia petrolearia]|uniref:tail fiber assembly protein n=1 Tax=Methanolacinia petrolearia TaxID=54120 RepID=UPI003BAA08D4
MAYEFTFEGKLEAVRTQRNRKLEESDKYVLQDFPIDDIEREEWLAYRLLLRDLPSTLIDENINTFEWPARPDEVTEAE